jgi:triosephosphate isomerase
VLALGAQDCHAEKEGAFTGDISASMLKEQGCRFVIVGHSERRAAYGETDSQVAAKAIAVLKEGMTPVICVGESWHERQAGMAVSSVVEGVSTILSEIEAAVPASPIVLAYEPIWAIGSGRTPSKEDIAEMHGTVQQTIAQHFKGFAPGLRVVYGGSVKPSNAAEIAAVPGVDGFLVGGASLQAESFLAICNS